MRQKVRYALALIVVVALAFGVYQVVQGNNNSQAGASSFSAFYLDVGASASLGFQPTGISAHNGRRTPDGYANDLVLMEGYKGMTLTLRQVGCPAETVQSILQNTVADHCYTLPKTQMSASVAFLQANQSEAGLVTVDLGFNNIRVCFSPNVVNEACTAQAIAAVGVDMPKILSQLKAAAGPHVRFVGIEYNDPYLADYLYPSNGPSNATASLIAMNAMDATLTKDFNAAGVAIANVPGIFQMDNTSRVTVPNVGVIPENVEEACELTWMCYSAPFGPDDHPNDAGYARIAQAIAAVLPSSW